MAQGSKTMEIKVKGVTKQIDLYDKKTGDLRSTFDILNDVVGKNGENWNNMTKAEQTAFATALGGKTQIDVLTAVLGNWDTAIKATNDALNSQGSASKENERFLKSLEGSLQALRSEWEQFATSTATRDLVGGLIKGATLGLKALNSDIGQFALKAGAVVGVIKLISKVFGQIKNGVSSLTTKIASNVFGIEAETKAVEKNTVAWKKNSKARKAPVTGGVPSKVDVPKSAPTKGASAVAETSKLAKVSSAVSTTFSTILTSVGLVGAGLAVVSGIMYAVSKHQEKVNNYWKDGNTKLQGQRDEIKNIDTQIQALEIKGSKRTENEDKTLEKLRQQKKVLEEQNQVDTQHLINEMVSGDENDGVYSTTQKNKDKQNLEETKKDFDQFMQLRKKAFLDENKDKTWIQQTYHDELRKTKGTLEEEYSQLKDEKAIMDDFVASGGKLTNDQKEYYAYLQLASKEYKNQLDALKALDKYGGGKGGISNDYAQEKAGTKEGRKELATLSKNIQTAMSGGKGATEAFNAILKQTTGAFVTLNGETKKYEIDGTKSLSALAKSFHMTEDELSKLLLTHQQDFTWNFSDEQIKQFNELSSQYSRFVDESSGKTTWFSTQVQSLADSMGISFAQASGLIQQSGGAILDLGGNAQQVVTQIKSLGDEFGIVTDKAGNIESIDFSALVSNLENAGLSAEQIANIIQQLSVETQNTDLFGGVKLSGKEAEAVVKTLNATIAQTPDAKVSKITLNDDGTISVVNKKLDATKQKEDTVSKTKPHVKVSESGAGKTQKQLGDTKQKADDVSGTYTVKVNGQDNTGGLFATIGQKLKNLLGITVEKYFAKGKRKGEQGGLAWVGEDGAELIETDDGAYLAGTQGWELVNLDNQDIVHTASETQRMLNNNIPDAPDGFLPRYAKGKKPKKPKKKKKKRKYLTTGTKQTKRDKKKEKALDEYVEYQQLLLDLDKITEKTYYDRIAKKIAPNRSSTFEQYKRYHREVLRGRHELAKEKKEAEKERREAQREKETQRRLGHVSELTSRAGLYKQNKAGINPYNQAVKEIKKLRKEKRISAEEEKELLKDLYTTRLDYFHTEYDRGKKTYSEMMEVYKKYAREGKITFSEFLEYRNELAEEQVQKEIERLDKLAEKEQQRQDLANHYLNKQINAIDKQIEAKEKEYEDEQHEQDLIDKKNEALEQEKELQDAIRDAQLEITKAQSKQVKIYREGQGFVYENDIEEMTQAQEALLEAQKNYTDWQDEQKKNEIYDKREEQHRKEIEALEEERQIWQNILDMMDERQFESEIKELENILGTTAEGLFSQLGTDISAWDKWFSETVGKGLAYGEVIKLLEQSSGQGFWDIYKLIGQDGQINSSYINNAIANNKFAQGTLSASGGFSLVGEKGAELRVLNRGDGIIPNNMTKNLMEWGQYSPTQWQNAMTVKARSTQTPNTIVEQNFDKIVLPNVTDSKQFIRDMSTLKNKALQAYSKR